MVLTESGNYAAVPEYRCKMTQAFPAACRNLLQEIKNGQAVPELDMGDENA